jgi:hypothetical protein
MLEIFLIGLLIFLILTFFYKQAICEFRINQIEWDKRLQLQEILSENTPTILRGCQSPPKFWTQEDVMMRSSYGSVQVFDNQGLSEWITTTDTETVCPWTKEHAEAIASVSGLSTWASIHLNTHVLSQLASIWHKPIYSCWTGQRKLVKTVAPWMAITPTEGEIVLTIMPENVAHALPSDWHNYFPGDLTQYDTPFVADLKYMDIIVRPGTIVFMPAHWYISWKTNGKQVPMVCVIEYHTPISRFAAAMGNSRT